MDCMRASCLCLWEGGRSGSAADAAEYRRVVPGIGRGADRPELRAP